MALQKVLKGDCDCCTESVNVTVYVIDDMKMCESCKQKQEGAAERAASVNTLLVESRDIDMSVEIKTDVFTAATTSAIELKGAIDNDVNIPQSERDYIMAQRSMERVQHFQKILFDQQQAVLDTRNELRAWQTQVQQFAGKLRAEQREQFRNLDIQYTPKVVKVVKPAKAGKPKAISMKEVKEISVKYGIPGHAITMTAQAQGLSPEGAAKYITELKRQNKEKQASTN